MVPWGIFKIVERRHGNVVNIKLTSVRKVIVEQVDDVIVGRRIGPC